KNLVHASSPGLHLKGLQNTRYSSNLAVISAYKLVSPEQAISWHGATLLKKILLTLVLLFLISFGAGAQNTRPQVVGGVPAETRADLRQETFDIVWRTVKEKHFDPTLGGVDWDKVREQYAPRAAAAKTDNELYGILRQMLGELHQSHFNI